MKNIEYKAELRDPDLARAIASQIGANLIVKVQQTDTYFNVASGRLKKREAVALDRAVATPEPVEYIVYERANRVNPRASDYSILTEPELRQRYGQAPLPVWLTVSKIRELWMWRSVRIHLDKVDHLGWFFEIESLVREPTDEQHARLLAEQIRATFAPVLGEPVAGSYSDLLEQHHGLEPD
jgi:adenylate cyclase class 2